MEVTQDVTIVDIVSENLTVNHNSTLIINGIVNGDVIIKHGSVVIIYGIVNGNVDNNGYCEIHGVVNGKVIGGKIDVKPDAVIGVR